MAGDEFFSFFRLTKHNTTQYKHLDLLQFFIKLKDENLKINNYN